MEMNGKMNSEIKQKWVAALRSGNYKQGTSFLRDAGDYFCCLGVLCDIEQVPCKSTEEDYAFEYKFEDARTSLYSTLSVGFSNKMGLSSNNLDDLVDLNDNKRLSFSEIADYIEKNL
jgi:hypothetical protein